jgi:hypothetical protein
MKRFSFLSMMAAFVMVASFTSCENDPDPVPLPEVPGEHGVFILNQGSSGGNNAGISYYNFETEALTPDILNGTLGSTAQDLLIYGSKLYVSVHQSNRITVLDVHTHREVGHAEVDSVRYLEAYNGKLYASAYSRGGQVLQIDTTDFGIDKTTPVGSFPEGMAIADGKLYVANSGWGADSTLSVVNLANFTTAPERITVGVNPYILKADGKGNIFVSYQGDWYMVPGGFQKLDTKTGKVEYIDNAPKQDFVIYDGSVYYYDVDYTLVSTGEKIYGKYNIATGKTTRFDGIASEIKTTPYAIGVNPSNGDIYVGESDYVNPGKVTIFDEKGAKQTALNVGMNPCRFAFY